MQTSALRQSIEFNLSFAGTVDEPAVVRSRLSADGLHTVPVLCVKITTLTEVRKHLCIEVPYTELTRPQAEAQAKELFKGRCLSFDSSTDDMRIVFPNVSKITVL